MKDIVNVLNGLGAEIDAKSKSRLGVTLNGRATVLHLGSHSLLKAEVMQIRSFLNPAGLTPRPIRFSQILKDTDDGTSVGSAPIGVGRRAAAILHSPELDRGSWVPHYRRQDQRPAEALQENPVS
jgi:hypothetical protein